MTTLEASTRFQCAGMDVLGDIRTAANSKTTRFARVCALLRARLRLAREVYAFSLRDPCSEFYAITHVLTQIIDLIDDAVWDDKVDCLVPLMAEHLLGEAGFVFPDRIGQNLN
jgi:hypothetical protein